MYSMYNNTEFTYINRVYVCNVCKEIIYSLRNSRATDICLRHCCKVAIGGPGGLGLQGVLEEVL